MLVSFKSQSFTYLDVLSNDLTYHNGFTWEPPSLPRQLQNLHLLAICSLYIYFFPDNLFWKKVKEILFIQLLKPFSVSSLQLKSENPNTIFQLKPSTPLRPSFTIFPSAGIQGWIHFLTYGKLFSTIDNLCCWDSLSTHTWESWPLHSFICYGNGHLRIEAISGQPNWRAPTQIPVLFSSDFLWPAIIVPVNLLIVSSTQNNINPVGFLWRISYLI